MPGPAARRRRDPAGEPVAGPLAADPATVFWVLVSDPGAFIMERRMLKGIKHRVEGAAVRPAA